MEKSLFHIGRYVIMIRKMLIITEKIGIYWIETMKEVLKNGISSIAIVVIMSSFIGAVLTLQTSYQLVGSFFPVTTIGSVVSASSLLEMAPTITSLVLAGKIGSNICSEIGSMRISEQIDAIEVMGVNSSSYLIFPKMMGAILSFPCLIIIAAFFNHLGGMVAGAAADIITMDDFLYGARSFFQDFYVTFMIIKSVVFGFVVSTVASYQGYYVEGGAIEVGKAGTRSMVYSCIMLVISDFLLAKYLL